EAAAPPVTVTLNDAASPSLMVCAPLIEARAPPPGSVPNAASSGSPVREGIESWIAAIGHDCTRPGWLTASMLLPSNTTITMDELARTLNLATVWPRITSVVPPVRAYQPCL